MSQNTTTTMQWSWYGLCMY